MSLKATKESKGGKAHSPTPKLTHQLTNHSPALRYSLRELRDLAFPTLVLPIFLLESNPIQSIFKR